MHDRYRWLSGSCSNLGRSFVSCVLVFAVTSALRAQETRVPAAEFAAQAYASLPVEETFAFHKALSEWREPPRRMPAARPGPREMTIAEQGWGLVVPSGSGPVLQHAAEEFREYLERAMQVPVALRTTDSLANWASLKNSIVAGPRDKMPGCGSALRGKKDYQIIVTPERVAVCGFDERGAMYGLYNLEHRMNLREAPFLQNALNIARYSLYRTRMTLSGLGWMEWPDPYLALLARYGFDSIFTSVYANPNGEGTWNHVAPYTARVIKVQDKARMHDLIRRAARFGIDIY